MSQQPNPTPMKIGGKYNWKGQPDRLIYLGRNWSGDPRAVWCEVLDSDLHMIEETKEANHG